ncbi:hypothetical protein Tco_0816416 [Tanacetum coccineum]
MDTAKIDADLQGTLTDQIKYHSMIGGLMYLTASRPDILFATFVCACYQARLTEKHIKEVKKIFRYLRQSINKGLWYSKDSGFELIAYSDADLAGCLDDYISTFGGLYIPCSPECKIVGHILLDHPLSYALTTIVDVPAVYLQQFWKTVSKVPDTKDTIRFKLDTQEIVYTVDMFHDTLKLPVETPDNLFVAPVNIEIIESFMHMVGYQGVVDKVSAFYTKFLAQPWQTMFEVFNRYLTTRRSGYDQTKINILQLFHAVINRTNVDYVALLWWNFNNCVFQKKDGIQYPHDIPLVSVYTTWNVTVRGMLISDAFLTREIRATDDYKEYETVTPTLTASPQGKKRKHSAIETSSPRKSLKATLLSLTLHKTALDAEAQENVVKVQEKLEEEEIEKMVEGEEDEESYASEFAYFMFNDDDDDDFGTRIEPGSHKVNPEVVDDDEVNDKEKQDEKKDDDAEKMDDAAEKKDNDDHTYHALVGTHATGSMETRKEQMQTPIPTPTRSPRKDLSLDKIIYEEFMANVSPTTASTSKVSSKSKSNRGFTSNKTKILPGSIVGMCR